uniref:hypothetical protein n=1 Tax=Azospirillum argentinense TaxID=2970906 RepID=UPI001FFFC13D|nr:hypothetical protein [Azospirillum argentinense]
MLIAALMIGGEGDDDQPGRRRLIAKYNQLQDRYLKLKSSSFDVSRSGLWLRQQEAENSISSTPTG